MTLHAQTEFSIPEETLRIAHAEALPSSARIRPRASARSGAAAEPRAGVIDRVALRGWRSTGQGSPASSAGPTRASRR